MIYTGSIEMEMAPYVRRCRSCKFKTMKTVFCILIYIILTTPLIGLAHPGNTASDGCHYCRTNCAKWGEVKDERHCHYSESDSSYPESDNRNSYSNSASARDDRGNSWLWWLGGAGLLGYFAWAGNRKG